MKEPHSCSVQLAFSGKDCGFSDVAKQHVGALNRGKRAVVCSRNCLLDETLFQPDPKVSCHDLDNVLGFERCDPREQLAYKSGFGGWASSACDRAECFLNFEESKVALGAMRKYSASDRS